MAFTYTWDKCIDLCRKQVKSIPTQGLDAMHCDMVSARIANKLPWKSLLTSIADGQIPLIDGQQDYDPPFNIYRLLDASLHCTSTNPNDDVTIVVRDSLTSDSFAHSPYGVTSVAMQADAGKLRLSCAVRLQQGETWELRGTYQIGPTRITSTTQPLWFDDRYVEVAIEGLSYWYYKLADDPRMAAQFTLYNNAIMEMALAEDIGGDMQAFPDDPMGIASSQYGAMVVGYGIAGGSGGSGGGTGGGGSGLISINSDMTPAQRLLAGAGITVTDAGAGGHTISALGVSFNFADGEVVSGSGTSWVLVHAPNPPASLELYQALSGFGSILLKAGTDYTLSGANITTVNSITAGALASWYRY